MSCASGDVIFSSKDKFQTGRGRPSFYKPVDPSVLEPLEDDKLVRIPILRSMCRQEARVKSDQVHLGYVFYDQPMEKGGFRYTINSAVVNFTPY